MGNVQFDLIKLYIECVTNNGKGGGNGASGDPSMLVDAAGTFVCLPKRPCTVSLVDIDVKHANASSQIPPRWVCNSSHITTAGAVQPPLTGACLGVE